MDTPTPSITLDDLIAALEQAQHGEQENIGLSTGELCALTGWSERKVWDALHELMLQGRLCVRKQRQKNMVGDWKRVPVYWLVPEPATKEVNRLDFMT